MARYFLIGLENYLYKMLRCSLLRNDLVEISGETQLACWQQLWCWTCCYPGRPPDSFFFRVVAVTPPSRRSWRRGSPGELPAASDVAFLYTTPQLSTWRYPCRWFRNCRLLFCFTRFPFYFATIRQQLWLGVSLRSDVGEQGDFLRDSGFWRLYCGKISCFFHDLDWLGAGLTWVNQPTNVLWWMRCLRSVGIIRRVCKQSLVYSSYSSEFTLAILVYKPRL